MQLGTDKWFKVFGGRILRSAKSKLGGERLDAGCLADCGTFWRNERGSHSVSEHTKPVTRLLLKITSRQRVDATVPMVDKPAYPSKLEQVKLL